MKRVITSLLIVILVSTIVIASHSSENMISGLNENSGVVKELKIGEKDSLIKTRLKQDNESNADKLQVKLSSGRNAEIKITPEIASKKVLKKLKLKNCDEQKNCTIEIREVGEGENTKLIYEAKVQKTFRLFGFFKSQREVVTQIDAETGKEILTTRPWWSWMTSEENF